MTVRHLDFFLAERRLIQTDEMSILKGIRLGIDGYAWIKKLLGRDSASWINETLPWNWKKILKHELEVFNELEITPVFVFPGLQPLRKKLSNDAGNDWESTNRTSKTFTNIDNPHPPTTY